MAIAFVENHGGATEKTVDDSHFIQPATTIPVGAQLILCVATDNPTGASGDSTFHTVTDTALNTWVRAHERTRSSAGSAGDGVVASVWVCDVIAELTTGDSITVTLGEDRIAKAMRLLEYSAGAGMKLEKQTSDAAHGQAVIPGPTVTLSGMPSQQYLLIGAMGQEDPGDKTLEDLDYTNRTSTGTSGGGLATNISIHPADRIATLTGDTYTPTNGSTLDWSIILAAFKEVSAGGAVVNGSAVFSGTGTLTAQGTRETAGSASFTGAGALSAQGTREVSGTGSFSGAGFLSAAGVRETEGTAAFSGTGDLTASGVRLVDGVASLSGTGSLTATGLREVLGTSSFSGVGTLTATGEVETPTGEKEGTASFSGTGTLTATGLRIVVGTAAFSGSGDLTADGVRLVSGTAEFTGTGEMTAQGFVGGIGLPVPGPTRAVVRSRTGAAVDSARTKAVISGAHNEAEV